MKVVTGVLMVGVPCPFQKHRGWNEHFAHLTDSRQRVTANCQVKVEVSACLREKQKDMFDGLNHPVSPPFCIIPPFHMTNFKPVLKPF